MSQVYWDDSLGAYAIKEKIGNQTLLIGFQEDWQPQTNTCYYNVYLSVYTKRKHMELNEEKKLSTGLNPIKDFLVARKNFQRLEKYVLNDNKDNNVVIYCFWVDSRRRDTYYKVLSRWGYTYQKIDPAVHSGKVIAKKFIWNEETQSYD